MGRNIIRANGQGSPVGGDGLVQLARLDQHQAEVIQGLRVVPIDGQCGAVVRERLRQPSRELKRVPQVVVAFGEVRTMRQRLFVMPNRQVELARPGARNPQRMMRNGRFAVDLDGKPQRIDRLREPVLLQQEHSQGERNIGIAR